MYEYTRPDCQGKRRERGRVTTYEKKNAAVRCHSARYGLDGSDRLVRVLAALLLSGGLSACAGGAAGPAADGTPQPAAQDLAAPAADRGSPVVAPDEAIDKDKPAVLKPVTRPDEQLLIMELRLRDSVLSEGFFAYFDKGGLLVPLGEFVRALEFPIAVDPENGRASGWFIREDRLFSLDLLRREAVIDGRPQRFDRNLVELHQDEIYVDTRLLAKWFPVDITFDLSNLLVRLESREALPMELRLEREGRRRAAAGRLGSGAVYPSVASPYQWAGWPSVNLSAEAGYRKDSLGEGDLTARYNMLAGGDFLKHEATLFVAGNEDLGVSQARFEMGRRDPDAELLGPVGATEYSFGDIAMTPVDLIARSRFGRGAQVSSFPLDRVGQFDRTTVIGDLPLGWEVELYRNDVLLDFQTARDDGRYEFADVPLLVGLNILTLEFFGPQGQRRTEVRRILVGQGQVQPGKAHFRLAANQQDENLLPVDGSDTLSVTDAALQGEPRALAEVEYGISRNVSVAGSVSTIPLISGRRSYGSLGLRTGFGPVYSRLDVIRDSEGGMAGKFGAQISMPLNLSLLADHSEFRDFVSETIVDDGDLPVRNSNLRLDGVVSSGNQFRLPFTFGATREQSESGATDTTLTNRLSTVIQRVSFSNNLEWRKLDTATIDSTTMKGTFLAGGRVYRASLRGELRYNIQPESELTTASLTSETRFRNGVNARLGVQRTFVAPTLTTVTAGLSRTFSFASMGITGGWSNDGSWNALLSYSTSFGRDPRTGEWHVSAKPAADYGSASVRAFLDNDLDGAFGPDDTPLQGVVFDSGVRRVDAPTDGHGVAFLPSLPAYRDLDLTISPQSLEDPYWVPDPEGYRIRPRPGNTIIVDFPVVVTGEVDGTVYLQDGGTTLEVADVALQLVAADGTVVGKTESVFDGFFLFEFVRPGRYRLRVDPDQLARLNLRAEGERSVDIEGSGTIVSAVQILLRPAASP